tara:strand:+ start:112 stop:327 length:216 start_codon:yes stop_codon:yes gene_type:complete
MFKESKSYTLKSGAKATIERVQMEMRGGQQVPGRVRYAIEGMPRITVTAETWLRSVKPAEPKPKPKAKPKK